MNASIFSKHWHSLIRQSSATLLYENHDSIRPFRLANFTGTARLSRSLLWVKEMVWLFFVDTLAQINVITQSYFFSIRSQLTQILGSDQRKWRGLGSNLDRWRRSRMLYLTVPFSVQNQCFYEKYQANELLARLICIQVIVNSRSCLLHLYKSL